ncbi:bis(5'-nucleosyl)-tetraphosphatase (symmetrical) YqeK [Alloiococcus sp. CFN-8]|uniref:bis(5'-nucleosyl)-tetraphosphatase (symmetrical) YqeK n=1 Tax=Alloiococcus sp. CFN-8 TaxID=3416081 RepID=UPI003CED952D
MWSEEKIKAYLIENIKEKRVKHILGVAEMSEKLAEFYGESTYKARIAAYIHDVAKYMPKEVVIRIIEEKGYELTPEDLLMPELLHGLAGAIIGRDKMGIEDEEILNAARYHTTGRVNMSKLEKIVFLADYIEPGRDFPGVEELREMAFLNLDKGVLLAFDSTIKHVVNGGKLLHTDTIISRNYILQSMKQREE